MEKSIIMLLASLPAFSFIQSAPITPLWLRDCQISPDGREIAFTYKGDIWMVDAAGGQAVRLTSSPTYETSPIWSPDSKSIAYASDKYGNFDIFIMPAAGGSPQRLTFNSASEVPESFTPDGKQVVFSASIQDPAESALFPASKLTELYAVPVSGGKYKQILATPAKVISYMPDGKSFLYHDTKGMENEWRKHHTSSIASDIWKYDAVTGAHTNVTNHAGEDRNPISIDGDTYYFLSERDGKSMNVYKASLSDASAPQAVTKFKTHPVRFLSKSNAGTLCFGYNGEIYTLKPGGKPEKVAITLLDENPDETYKASLGTPSEIVVSPDGKSVAFINRGDVYVTSVEYKTTKQITNTPEAEKHLAWGHDSKSLVYTSERDGRYNIYQAKMARDEDPNFENATVIEEKPLFKLDEHERTVPKVSPDGKKLSFILDRRKLAVKDLDSGKVNVITDGKTVTDYEGTVNHYWSPDSKWIAMEGVDRKHDPYADILLVNAETGEMHNLTQTGYFDTAPRWVFDGNAIMFASDRYGMRNHASWGSQEDVMIVFLNQEAYDNYKLSKEDAEILKDQKKDKKKEDKDEKTDDKTIVVDFNNISDRVVRLTPFSSSLTGAFLDKDEDKLYFITKSQDNNMLWKLNLKGGEVEMSKTIAKTLKDFDYSTDENDVFIVGSTINKFSPNSLKLTPVTYSATYKLDPAKERQAMYENMVREEQARFYDVKMHGVDWKSLTDNYRRFLPYINNNYDFAEMASELLGELNVSHTGSGYRGNSASYKESTAELGLLYELNYGGSGMLVDEVVEKGPFDNASTKVHKGTVIEKINGIAITPEDEYTTLLIDLAGKKTLVSAYDPATGERWDEVVEPITPGKMSDLLYDRWVKARAADVDRWSNGRLGYVHIEGMNDASFRPIYADILGKYNDREGIVIDIRRNGGGRMHEDIEILFSGQKYLTQVVRGEEMCDMPSRRWNKPSIMVTAEACYSNAHGTPWVYKHQGLGKIVGMPVPGTMTSVNWVNMQDPSLYFGIPVTGYRTAEGYYLENHQLEPDVKVNNNPADIVRGEDAQLRTAVEELLKEIDAKK